MKREEDGERGRGRERLRKASYVRLLLEDNGSWEVIPRGRRDEISNGILRARQFCGTQDPGVFITFLKDETIYLEHTALSVVFVWNI